MTWWKNYHYRWAQKAMPLPFAPPATSKRGLELIDREMSQEIADQQRAEQVSYLGSGYNGLATLLPNDQVRKYSLDERESLMADYLRQNPLPCTVRVYKVQRLGDSGKLWAIDAERVRPLSYNEQDIADHITGDLWDSDNLNNLKAIRQYFEHYKSSYPQDMDFLDRLLQFYTCLISNRLYSTDTIGVNLGWRDDEIVLLDLGGLRPII